MSAPAQGHSSPRQKRARVLIACQRCKYRKQKCDGLAPICSGCRKADVRCVWDRSAAGRVGGDLGYPADYVAQLEQRVASLEGLLRSHAPEIAEDHMDSPPAPAKNLAKTQDDPAATPDGKNVVDVYDELSNSVGLLSLNAAAEPYFLGSTSGFSLARMVHSILSSSFSAATREQLDFTPRGQPQPQFGLVGDWAAVEEAGAQIEFPPKHIIDQLVAMYLNRIHSRYPLLDRVAFLETCERRHELDPNIPSDRMRLFTQHMVIAIGARNFQLILSPKDCVVPEAHYAAALRYLDAPLQIHGIENVQALLLLSIFSLRASGSLGALGGWHVLGLAMRMAVELGLHRKSKPRSKKLDPYRMELRKRVFWTGYILDRTLCITLGRPFAVAEHEIDVDLPTDISDHITDSAMILSRLKAPPILPNPNPTNISSFIHMIRLCRIESRIQRTIYGTDATWATHPNDPIFDNLLQDLAEWKATVPFPANIRPDTAIDRRLYESQEFFHLFYSKAVRLLLQPRISTQLPQPPRGPSTPTSQKQSPASVPSIPSDAQTLVVDDRYLAICARAAGDVCQYYKRLHQATSVGYSLLSLHGVFTAGITLLYCVWVATTRQPSTPSTDSHPPSFDKNAHASIINNWGNDIRACSSVLFVIAERWPSAKKYRDAFEALASTMLDMVSAHRQPRGQDQQHQSSHQYESDGAESSFGGLPYPGPFMGASSSASPLPLLAADGGFELFETITNMPDFGGMEGMETMGSSAGSAADEHIWEMVREFLGDTMTGVVSGGSAGEFYSGGSVGPGEGPPGYGQGQHSGFMF